MAGRATVRRGGRSLLVWRSGLVRLATASAYEVSEQRGCSEMHGLWQPQFAS